MKSKLNHKITFSQAVSGYELAALARRLSKHTLLDYFNTYRKFHEFLACDPPIIGITPHQVQAFLAGQEVSKKTLLNYHTGLSALWTWCQAEGLVVESVLKRVQRPRPEKRAIVPYTLDDIRAMLTSLATTPLYSRPGKRASAHAVPHAARNRAIILLLVDTGIRSTELCELKINQVDLKNRRITVFGKGSKERSIPISPATGQAIWRYLSERKDDSVGDRLVTTRDGHPLDYSQLLHAMRVIGRRAGLRHVNVHRFRHTFAINFLRNGGDPYSLQIMLGHSTMEMVKTYLAIAQSDLDANHRRASPVANWRL